MQNDSILIKLEARLARRVVLAIIAIAACAIHAAVEHIVIPIVLLHTVGSRDEEV